MQKGLEMARPEPKILVEHAQANTDIWQILEAQQTYVLTYRGQPFDLRVVNHGLGVMKFKYKRTTYTQLGTALAQIRRYNKNFNTSDFDYITV
jgi:hypothetical protein